MTRPSLPRVMRSAPFAAFAFAALTTSVLAQGADQGTPEQREACAPDAVRLCPDTIPDVPSTTACMQAHRAQLSRRCRAVFAAATAAPPATVVVPRAVEPDQERIGVIPAEPVIPAPGDFFGPRRYRYLTPGGEAETGGGDED